MIPNAIEKRLANPSQLEKDFLNYLRMSNAPIQESKTISFDILYHQKDFTNLAVNELFTGEFIQANTNIEGNSFVRPNSEHFLIFGMGGYVSDKLGAGTGQWNKGFTSDLAFTDAPEGIFTNATLDFLNNGIKVLKDMPLTEFDNENLGGNDRGILWLDQPILWQGAEAIKITIKSNDPLNRWNVDGDQRGCIMIQLIGIGLI